MAYATHENRGSTDYKFTVTDLNDEMISEWKNYIKEWNLYQRLHELRSDTSSYKTRKVMRIRPRLGKNSPFAHLYKRGGPLYRMSSQEIKREHGTRFDIYVTEKKIWK